MCKNESEAMEENFQASRYLLLFRAKGFRRASLGARLPEFLPYQCSVNLIYAGTSDCLNLEPLKPLNVLFNALYRYKPKY